MGFGIDDYSTLSNSLTNRICYSATHCIRCAEIHSHKNNKSKKKEIFRVSYVIYRVVDLMTATIICGSASSSLIRASLNPKES